MRQILILLLFFICTNTQAQQVCSGTLGDPIAGAGTDFGNGATNNGLPITGNTSYLYVTGTPGDGQYTIAKTTKGMNSGWHQNITNHTPNDPNGYMMVVNADYNPGVFYKTTVTGLCPNTTYEFASYIINILNRSGIRPNIKFTIENDGVALAGGFSTGDIAESTTQPQWVKYGTTFTTPANLGVLTLTMTNDNPGGTGNDLALDDITFRACGPILVPKITNPTLGNNITETSICEGENINYTLEVEPPTGYTDPAYQWQTNTGTDWVDIVGANALSYFVQITNAVTGNYLYRLAAAESINIGSLKCRVVSAPLTITVKAKPTPNASNTGAYCVGDNIQLKATGGDTYLWTGPNSFSSTDQNPIILNATTAMTGDYTVTAYVNNCSNSTLTTVEILPPVIGATNIAAINICENTNTTLIASGGNNYSWSPVDGLSDPNSAQTTASPKETTTYTVKISNGACFDTKEITVNVIKNATADAGTDKKIIKGSSVLLQGKVSGDDVTYFWSPIDFLDDPTKLNPIATPPYDITYTLNAISQNCVSSSDDVFIKVYPKIEIPNSFSPNGDGFNDTWNIPAAQSFPNLKLKILNRYGAIVYQNNGEFKPWDGKFKGKDLPPATYYYTVYFNEDFKTYTGWVFLIR